MSTLGGNELTTREVAQRFGHADSSTVLRLVKAGRLVPAAKQVGRTGGYVFRSDDIDKYLEDRACDK